MPLLSSSRKAEEFARLLEGSGNAGSGSDLSTLQSLAARLASVPQPRPEFASALRERLMSEAVTTLPSGAAGAAGGGAGSGGAGGASGGASGSAGSVASSAGSSAAGSSGAGSAASAVSGAAGGTAAGGSALGAVMTATAPVWAQFTGVVAATAIALGGIGLGASQSLPGDPLYGVKRQIEQIQLELAGGRTDSALAQLGFARTRLSEIDDLLDGRNADTPLPADLQKRISDLLADWASETSQGTTALLDQLSAASGDVVAIRQKLTDFTASQARALALVVQQLPDERLQSYTGSAFAYLQRVDTALGNPVDLATLLPSLGLPLPSTTTSTGTTPTGTSRTGTSGGGSGGGNPAADTPSSVPTLPIPANGSNSGGGGGTRTPTTPKIPTTPSLPTGGPKLPDVPGTLDKTVDGGTNTVTGVLNGVTGKGPALPLPTSVPPVPGLGR